MEKFESIIEVRWADVDQNRHVRHSAYYDFGAHCRIRFFAACGFSSQQMEKLQIGPIIFKEECSFIRELRADDTVTTNLQKGTLNEDVSRWVLHHQLFNDKGEKCAHITLKGAWMDLSHRKLTAPPAIIATAFHALPAGEDYVYKRTKAS